MKKIDQSDKFLQEKMENTGINPVLAELKSWFLPMQKIDKCFKKFALQQTRFTGTAASCFAQIAGRSRKTGLCEGSFGTELIS